MPVGCWMEQDRAERICLRGRTTAATDCTSERSGVPSRSTASSLNGERFSAIPTHRSRCL